MNFNLQIDEDDEPIRRPSTRPAPDYLSRGFRLRLLSLFAALVVVLVLMKEAGKPSRWAWMGFDQQQAAQPEASDVPGAADSAAVDVGKQASKPTVPADVKKFWTKSFLTGTPAQRKNLFRLFRSIEKGQPVEPPALNESSELWADVVKQREQFDLDQLASLTQLPQGTTDRQQAADRSYEARDFWQKKIRPAVEQALSGEDCTLAQQQAIIRLRDSLADAGLGVVQDGTAVGHPDDAVAWSWVWEQVAASRLAQQDSAEPVSRVQLMSQPRSYRGNWVSLNGWVRSARKVNRPIAVLDANRDSSSNVLVTESIGYYELWLRPEDTNAGPVCVYARSLAGDFPEIETAYVETNTRVQVAGVFLKNRNYVAADSTTSVCPLILTQSVTAIAPVAVVQQSTWRPNGLTLALIIGALALGAAGLAWLARTTSLTPRYQPGESARQQINDSLDQFRDDPGVMTDREKVSALQQRLETHDAEPNDA